MRVRNRICAAIAAGSLTTNSGRFSSAPGRSLNTEIPSSYTSTVIAPRSVRAFLKFVMPPTRPFTRYQSRENDLVGFMNSLYSLMGSAQRPLALKSIRVCVWPRVRGRPACPHKLPSVRAAARDLECSLAALINIRNMLFNIFICRCTCFTIGSLTYRFGRGRTWRRVLHLHSSTNCAAGAIAPLTCESLIRGGSPDYGNREHLAPGAALSGGRNWARVALTEFRGLPWHSFLCDCTLVVNWV